MRILKGANIYYFQPAPPPLLDHHHGVWRVAGVGHDGAKVVSSHTVSVNHSAGAKVLAGLGIEFAPGEVEDKVEELIRGNSLQTMKAVKTRLETLDAQVQS